jgi:DNA polymerase-1
MTRKTLLIDGDMYAYQIACSDQTDVTFDGVPMSTADLETATSNLDLLLESFLERMEADTLLVALSDPAGGNFRKDVLPSYKDARTEIVNPIVRRALEKHLLDNYGAISKPGLEGDDILGIWATHHTAVPGRKIVVSGDKDLKSTIPGLHWNPKKDKNGEPVKVTGPVKAEKILTHPMSDHMTPWEKVVFAYEAKDLTEEDALVQARVARILRASDYDFKNQKPILWSPA